MKYSNTYNIQKKTNIQRDSDLIVILKNLQDNTRS